ncbi:IgA peptidase M64 [Kribbella pratensis]|uniref:IgA peptidase M64 n=1 Tax=Kribbella pratensis TaxID=2512112 RepID=A0ABY2F6R2_9ACTN|nr:M64 family metallopeptidase [Kribbella pratensis]TDW84064.1 IgA peptidase M64 [Kribbella pratensis]
MADSMTVLRKAGPPGTKRNIAVLGDGFTAVDQVAYNSWVQTTLIDGVFGHDYFSEDASAYNIYRVNLDSVDSGVSVRTYDEHGTPTDSSDDTVSSETIHDTALGMIFSGSWAHCWLEYGPDTEARIQAALNKWVPDWNELLVVLNNPNYGGCGGGGRAHVPMGVNWTVIAHEFGHGIGGFADEYSAGGAYTGGEQGWINLTTITDRATTKWAHLIAPATPLPTGIGSAADYNNGPRPADWNSNTDIGLFEGGGTANTGLYRPVENCRMKGNTPPYCPVCYTSIKTARDHETEHTFRNAYAGRFYGTGRSDLLLHHGTSIQLFRADGTALEHSFSAVERVPGSWQFMPNDQVYVGDFDGDGTDEVAIFNGTDWVMPYLGLLKSDGAGGLRLVARYDGDIPGWGGFAAHDRFLVADLNGDGSDDLVVVNTDDWSMPYVGLLRSTGTGFWVSQRYDGDIPGWGGLARHDEFFVGDLTGNGTDDLVVFNGDDWSMAYAGLFRANAGGYTMMQRYDGDIPGWGGLAQHDRLILGDFDGDGKCDVFVFNGEDWSMPYLGMFRSTGSGLAYVHRYDGDVPGWDGLARHDEFFAADIDGSGRCDLWAWNAQDWSTEYLGRMLSSGIELKADYVGDWVGEWNLGSVDRFEPARMTGRSGRPQLYVHNTDWFGVINGRRGITLDRIYYRWIHNYRHGRNW